MSIWMFAYLNFKSSLLPITHCWSPPMLSTHHPYVYYERYQSQETRREVIVCFVDIDGIVDYHCLNFLFIKATYVYNVKLTTNCWNKDA